MIFAEALTTLDEYRQFTSRRAGAGARQHHRVRQDAALHRCRNSPAAGAQLVLYPAVCISRDVEGRRDRLRCDCASEGTQKSVRRPHADPRTELYEVLGYHDYEQQARRALPCAKAPSNSPYREPSHEQQRNLSPPASSRRNPWHCRASTAGNTALCTVGRSGNDLHYRGYDILDLAEKCEFEEVALPARCTASYRTQSELKGYKAEAACGCVDCRNRRARWRCETLCPQPVTRWTSCAPARRCSAARCRRRTITILRGRATSPTGCSPAWARCSAYWYHYSHSGRDHRGRNRRRFDRRALPAPAARRAGRAAVLGEARCTRRSTCTPSTSSTRRPSRARVIAGTGSDMYSCICGCNRRAARVRSTAAPTKSPSKCRSATTTPDEAEADIRRASRKEVVIGFGHPVYTVSDPRNKVIKEVARQLSAEAGRHEDVRHRRSVSSR